jgi:hypothetical protein
VIDESEFACGGIAMTLWIFRGEKDSKPKLNLETA